MIKNKHSLHYIKKYNNGGVSFNTGNTEKKCKTKSDCDNAFDDLLDNEKVKCNMNTGLCDRYLHVDKHIDPKADCRKKINKDLAECITKKSLVASKKKAKVASKKKASVASKKKAQVASKKKAQVASKKNKIDCRKKINKSKKRCINKKK